MGLLGHLGIWGPMVLAVADSGAFGIPLDPVVIGYAWSARTNLLLEELANRSSFGDVDVVGETTTVVVDAENFHAENLS